MIAGDSDHSVISCGTHSSHSRSSNRSTGRGSNSNNNNTRLGQIVRFAAALVVVLTIYQNQVVLNEMHSFVAQQEDFESDLLGKVSDVAASAAASSPGNQLHSKNINVTSIVTSELETTPGLHVVVAHCDEPIEWIWKRYLDTEKDSWKSITILSKCGQAVPDPLPPRTQWIPLKNVGGSDHSYVYFIRNMATLLQDLLPLHPQDQVMFMKDMDIEDRKTDRFHDEAVPLDEMRETTRSSKQFACASRIQPGDDLRVGEEATNLAQKWTLGAFHLDDTNSLEISSSTTSGSAGNDFTAPVRPLANWLTWLSQQNAIDMPITTDLIPVCLGGHFMTKVERILDAPVGTWDPVLKSLSRGQKIEETYYMERVWAGLLSAPIPPEEQTQFLEKKSRIISPESATYTGLLVLKNEATTQTTPEVQST